MSRDKFTPAPRQASTPAQTNNSLANDLQNMIPEIKRVLPKHISADRMARIILTEVRKNPKLAECDRSSFFGSILQCSQLGLEPGGALQHAWLIPQRRKDGSFECRLQVGYQGLIDLIERDGRVTIHAHAVYENEIFDIDYGTDQRIVHKPSIGKGRGEIIGAYAIAKYKDGRIKFRFINLDDIVAARKRSQSADKGPWSTDFDAMATKTAIHRLAKYIPKSRELAEALEIDEKAELGISPTSPTINHPQTEESHDSESELLELAEQSETVLVEEEVK